jgi:hypothetical protein
VAVGRILAKEDMKMDIDDFDPEEIEREFSRDLGYDDFLIICGQKDITKAHAMRTWMQAGRKFDPAMEILMAEEERDHPEWYVD